MIRNFVIRNLKTSNTHNFLSVAPKIMKFVLMWSLFRDAFGKKVSKNLKIVRDHATLPKTGLSHVGTVGPLGVNWKLEKLEGRRRWMGCPFIPSHSPICGLLDGKNPPRG
jgi:hypothetical protein